MQVVFVKSLEASGRDVGQVDGRRPHPAQAVRLLHERFEDVQVALHLVEAVVRKARRNQAFAQRRGG